MFAVWVVFVLTLVISGPAAVFAEAVPETETVSAVQEESADEEGFPEEAAAENLTESAEVISEIPDTEEEPAEEIEEAEEAEAEEELEQGAEPSVRYRTHVQSFGWQDPVSDGAMSGTQGKAKRLEGIEISVLGADDLGVRYMTHIQTYGWESDWKYDGVMSGTQGESKRLEAIRIELIGTDAQYFDIWYCVHAQHFGWLDWTKNGAEAGTAGFAYRLEGIKIMILPRNSKKPAREGATGAAFYSRTSGPGVNTELSGVVYNTHVQTYGWQEYVSNGSMAGTYGESKRLEGIHIALANQMYSGDIVYRTHVQTYGWQGWKKNGEMSGTSGEAKRLEGIEIRLTGEMADHFDVYYMVHAQTYGWLDWACNGQMAGTSGLAKRLEGIKIVLLPKGLAAPGPTARPSVTAAEVPAVVPAPAPSYTPSVTPVTTTYVGNKNSGKFHYADCTSVSRMREYNKVFLSSREQAISLGYQPCQICHP